MHRSFPIVSLFLLLTACATRSEQERVDDYRALREAVSTGDYSNAETLLSRGAPLDAVHEEYPYSKVGALWAPYTEWAPPLYVAAKAGDVRMVQLLLPHKPLLEWACCDSLTALGEAAAAGHLDIVRLLLEAGANPMEATADGTTPLAMAKQNGHKDVAALLEAAMKVRE